MKIPHLPHSFLCAAALFAAAVSPAFAVSENYIPDNARFAVFIDAKTAINAPALTRFFSKDGIDLDKILKEAAMTRADAVGDVSIFLTEINPENFESAVIDFVIYAPNRVNAIYDRIALSKEIKAEPVNFSQARVLKVHSINGKTDLTAYFQFVSNDIMQCRAAINKPDTKPFIWPVKESPSMLVLGMKTKGSAASAAIDAAYVLAQADEADRIAKAAEAAALNKPSKIKAGGASFGINEEDPKVAAIRKNVKAAFARIAPAANNSLALTVTVRCANAQTRDDLFQTVDGLTAVYAMLSSPSFEIDKDGKLVVKQNDLSPLSSLKHEPKGNDAVFTMTLSEKFLLTLGKNPAAALGIQEQKDAPAPVKKT